MPDYEQMIYAIQTNLQDRAAAIESDPRLSDDAKAADVTALHAAAHVQQRDTMAQWDAADAVELRQAQQAAWKDDDVAGFRAALAGVGGISDPQAAQAAWERALLTGDRLQAKAVALVAVEKGYTEVVNRYVQEFPAAGAAIHRAAVAEAAAADAGKKLMRAWRSGITPPSRSTFRP